MVYIYKICIFKYLVDINADTFNIYLSLYHIQFCTWNEIFNMRLVILCGFGLTSVEKFRIAVRIIPAKVESDLKAKRYYDAGPCCMLQALKPGKRLVTEMIQHLSCYLNSTFSPS